MNKIRFLLFMLLFSGVGVVSPQLGHTNHTLAQTSEYGQPVADGTTLAMGTVAITETYNFSTDDLEIVGGVLQQDYKVCNKCAPQADAFSPYPSADEACTEAKAEPAAKRQNGFGNWTINVQCYLTLPGNAPSATVTTASTSTIWSTSNLPVFANFGPQSPCVSTEDGHTQSGVTIPAGVYGILRLENTDTETAYVIEFNKDTGPTPVNISTGSQYDGQYGHDAAFWWGPGTNCGSYAWDSISTDYCTEAVELHRDHRGWTIYRNGAPLGSQSDCIDP